MVEVVWWFGAVCLIRTQMSYHMKNKSYKNIQKENLQPSVCYLQLKFFFVYFLECLRQCLDINLIEMYLHDYIQVIHAQKTSNVAELKQFYKDMWSKIPSQSYNRLTDRQ